MELISGRMTSKGQITIPKELRDMLAVSEGDQLRFIISEDGKSIKIEPIKKKALSDAIGKINAREPIDLEKMREAVHEKAANEIYSDEVRDNQDD